MSVPEKHREKIGQTEASGKAPEWADAAAEDDEKAFENSNDAAADDDEKAFENSDDAAADDDEKAFENSDDAAADDDENAFENSDDAAADDDENAFENSDDAAADDDEKAFENSDDGRLRRLAEGRGVENREEVRADHGRMRQAESVEEEHGRREEEDEGIISSVEEEETEQEGEIDKKRKRDEVEEVIEDLRNMTTQERRQWERSNPKLAMKVRSKLKWDFVHTNYRKYWAPFSN